MLPFIQLGPLSLRTDLLILMISLWVAITIVDKQKELPLVSNSHLSSIIFLGLISGVVGGRIGYFIEYPQAFLSNFWSILSPSPSLLHPGFGLMVSALSIVIYAQKFRLPLLTVMNRLTIPVGVLISAIPLILAASGKLIGKTTDFFLQFQHLGEGRHPIGIYFFLFNSLLLACLWYLHRKTTENQFQTIILKYFFFAGIGLCILISLVSPITSSANSLLTIQVVAWCISLFSAAGYFLIQKKGLSRGKEG
ncbi:MAG: prolipoprotein diacylglyceryl transferase [Anaerolineales bacterium]|nr:prolipoprotein diacylglyceryl transferase [Anaerolineales bacterium]